MCPKQRMLARLTRPEARRALAAVTGLAAAATANQGRRAEGISDTTATASATLRVQPGEVTDAVGCRARSQSRPCSGHCRSNGLRTPSAPRLTTCSSVFIAHRAPGGCKQRAVKGDRIRPRQESLTAPRASRGLRRIDARLLVAVAARRGSAQAAIVISNGVLVAGGHRHLIGAADLTGSLVIQVVAQLELERVQAAE